MIWHVYLVRCADGSLYCGITRDVERRLAQHNGTLSGGAIYTRSRRPVELVATKLWKVARKRSKWKRA